MRKAVLGALSVVIVCSLALAFKSEDGQAVAEVEGQLGRGAALYALRCSVCHGATGQGLAEARLAFPEDHQRCSRCHRPGNPARMANPFIDNNMFDVGDAPALVGEAALTSFPNAAALYTYVQATMPRHAPGTLTKAEFLDVVAHVLHLNGALSEGAQVTEGNAATFVLP